MAELPIKVPALGKLIEVVASGIGAVAGPVVARLTASMKAKTRRIETEAEADARRILAKADADSLVIKADGHTDAVKQIAEAQENALLSGDGEISIGEEISMRLQFQEQKRQININNVVSMAAEELTDKDVPDHDVDHDWTARFFSDVQDVTSQQMQRIWARILSGEVETPGRTSLHALAILKNMSQRDADDFANASRFVLSNFILRDRKYTDHLNGFPSDYDILKLDSYGLYSYRLGLHRSIPLQNEGSYTAIFFPHRQMAYGILSVTNQKTLSIPAAVLTVAGKQLYDNIDVNPDNEYLLSFARYLKEKASARLIYAPILEENRGRFRAGQYVDVLTGQSVMRTTG